MLLSKSACIEIAIPSTGSDIVVISLFSGLIKPICLPGMSVNQIFPSLSMANEIEVIPSKSNDSNFLLSIVNFQILDALGSLIQIEPSPS